MRVIGELLRTLGLAVAWRRAALAWRIRRALMLVLLMGSTGLAIGYTVVRHGRQQWDPDEADELG